MKGCAVDAVRASGWGLLGVLLGLLVVFLAAGAVAVLPFHSLAGFLVVAAVLIAIVVRLTWSEERALAVGIVLGGVLTALALTWLPAY